MSDKKLDLVSNTITILLLVLVEYLALYGAAKIIWGLDAHITLDLFLVFALGLAFFKGIVALLTMAILKLSRALDRSFNKKRR